MLDLVNTAFQSIENGMVPDFLIRTGIRHLLKQRLKSESSGSCEEVQDRLEEFVRKAASSHIAIVPERANEQHYEIPAEFFSLVLGENKKYSSCYWTPETNSLTEAENKALQISCEHAGIENGMRILELGCGWGSLSLWMAKNYPDCRITAVSNSASQKSFIDSQGEQFGLTNLNVITADMNTFETDAKYDRVVSVEMFEHMRNHQELMRKISGWLENNGKLFVHIFCHKELTYEFQEQGAANWMGRYFFSGGMMPGDSLLPRYQKHLKLEKQWRWNGKHYEKTCNAWLKNMDANKERILSIFKTVYPAGQEHLWFQRWRLFFMACAELFGYRDGEEWWISHYLFNNGKN